MVTFSKSGLRKSNLNETAEALVPVNIDRTSALRNAMIPCQSVAEYTIEIGKLWQHARVSFVLIGRYLNEAKDRLPHGEFESMVQRELPFSKSQAFQFRAVATMIDGGRLQDHEVPSSPSIAYELSKYEPFELEDARKRGLLTSTVSRQQLRNWRRDRSLANLGGVSEHSKSMLRGAMLKKIAKLREQLQLAEQELAKLDEQAR
jgi:hypothetical protein